jgi:site-specific DNA recombinase
MKSAALYVRVSTDAQAEEGYSIEFQTDKLKSYCDATSMTVKEIFTDPGYSGSNLERPGLKKLLKHIKEFNVVVVYKLDRLSRSQKDTLHLIEDVFIPNDVAFISLSESFDTGSAFGRATIGILSVFSQLERENIKQRMMAGKVQKAKNGLSAGQINTAIGYRKVDGNLVVDEYEREQILKIAELYISGVGARSIVKEMKEFTTAYGNWCNSSTVMSVLFNPLYRGIIKYSGSEYPGQHERIISEEMYEKILEQKKRVANGEAFIRTYLLSGIIYCAHCGSRLAAKNTGNAQYYACYNRHGSCKHMVKTNEKCCLPFFRRDTLDSIVDNEIKHIFKNIESIIKEHKKENNIKDTSAYTNKIEKIDKQMIKMLDLYQFSDLSVEDLRKRMESLKIEKDKLQSEIERVDKYDYSKFRESVKVLYNEWDTLTINEKRKYMFDIFNKIIVDKGRNIDFDLKCGNMYK